MSDSFLSQLWGCRSYRLSPDTISHEASQVHRGNGVSYRRRCIDAQVVSRQAGSVGVVGLSVLPQDIPNCPQKALAETLCADLAQPLHDGTALLLNGLWDMMGQPHRCGPTPWGKAEHVDLRELQGPDHPEAFGKLLLALSRKAHHDVCGDRQVRDDTPCSLNKINIIFYSISPTHTFEGGIAPALERQVEVWTKAWVPPELQRLHGEVLGLDAGEAKAWDIRLLEDGPYEQGQTTGWRKAAPAVAFLLPVAPIGSHGNAGEHHFLIPLCDPLLDETDHFVQGETAGWTPRDRNNAICTMMVAAILHLDEAAGTREGVGGETIAIVRPRE